MAKIGCTAGDRKKPTIDICVYIICVFWARNKPLICHSTKFSIRSVQIPLMSPLQMGSWELFSVAGMIFRLYFNYFCVFYFFICPRTFLVNILAASKSGASFGTPDCGTLRRGFGAITAFVRPSACTGSALYLNNTQKSKVRLLEPTRGTHCMHRDSLYYACSAL